MDAGDAMRRGAIYWVCVRILPSAVPLANAMGFSSLTILNCIVKFGLIVSEYASVAFTDIFSLLV